MGIDLAHPKHPERVTLLAWSDGELPWWQSWLVKRHVRGCWHCKAQVSDLESIVCAVSLNIEQLPEPGRVDVARAYWRFLEAVRERETNEAAPRQVRAWRPGPSWAIAAVAILATAALAYVVNWPGSPQTEQKPVPAVRRSPPSLARPEPARKHVEPVASLLSPPDENVSVRPPVVAAEDELAAAEIHALAALHRSRFCLTSGITVRRASLREFQRAVVEVSGPTQSRDQRDRISGILAGIGSPEILKVRLTEPAEPADLADGVSAGSDTSTNPDTVRVTPPILVLLRESLPAGPRFTERDISNLMNAMAREAERVSSEAWALRHLAEHYPPSRTQNLRPDLAVQLLQLVDDHAIALASELKLLHAHLHVASAGRSPEERAPASRAYEPWQSSVLTLQKSAEDVVRQLLASFSTAPGSALRPGRAPGDDAALLHALAEQTRTCFSLAEHLRSDLQISSARASR